MNYVSSGRWAKTTHRSKQPFKITAEEFWTIFTTLLSSVMQSIFFFFNFILFFHIDITRLYKPVLKISINCSLWGQPGKKPIIKCHGDKQTSLEKDLQMRCHYKISKKEKVHSKYYQKHLNLVSTFSTSGNINFFFFLYSFVMYSSPKSHYGAKEKWTATVRCGKESKARVV